MRRVQRLFGRHSFSPSPISESNVIIAPHPRQLHLSHIGGLSAAGPVFDLLLQVGSQLPWSRDYHFRVQAYPAERLRTALPQDIKETQFDET